MYDVAIIGAGASGIMAAIELSKRKFKVVLIEKNSQIGKKILLTGKGRCNLTNDKPNSELIKHIHNGIHLYQSLNNFGSQEIIKYFSSEVPLTKEEDDKIFPKSNKAIDINNFLQSKLNNVEILFNTTVNTIKKDKNFNIITNNKTIKSKYLVIATGGKSYPATGSTGDGYEFAKNFNHKIEAPYAAETGLITDKTYDLMGISTNVKIKYQNIVKSGELLFTHKGISGPAVLNISGYVSKNLENEQSVYIDFIPNKSIEDLYEELNKVSPKKEIQTWLKDYLPLKLSRFLVQDFTNIKIASISKSNKMNILETIKNKEIKIKTSMPIESAITTGGGISLDEIDLDTFQSKKCENLYFCGEVLDFHGEIGGYNLTIAFSTGYTVGNSIKKDYN